MGITIGETEWWQDLGRAQLAAEAFEQVARAGDDWATETGLRAATLRRELGAVPIDGGPR